MAIWVKRDGNELIVGCDDNWDRPCPKCKARPGDPCRRPNGDRYTTVYGGAKFHFARGRNRMENFNRTRARSRALETLPPAYDLKNGQREEGAFIFHIVEPAQASQRLCPKAPDGGTHHLAPKGPAGARVLTCVHCRRSQREIERDD